MKTLRPSLGSLVNSRRSRGGDIAIIAADLGAFAVYDPDDGQYAGQTEYAAVIDELGNLPDLAQGTLSLRPERDQISTGRYVMSSVAGTRWLETAAFTVIPQPGTTVVLYRFVNAASGVSETILGGPGAARQMFRKYLDDAMHLWAGAPTLVGPQATANWHIAQLNWNGATTEFFRDGVSVASGSTGTNSIDQLRLFLSVGGSDPLTGQIGPVIIFDSLKTPAELDDLYTKLNALYPIGLSA